jgi:hypothetical protein
LPGVKDDQIAVLQQFVLDFRDAISRNVNDMQGKDILEESYSNVRNSFDNIVLVLSLLKVNRKNSVDKGTFAMLFITLYCVQANRSNCIAFFQDP